MITIFTDGSSRGNPGPGGWGAVIVEGGQVTELGGGDPHTTNNKMELLAVTRAVAVTPSGSSLLIYTDSSYVINGVTKWIKGWKRNGWQTKLKQDVLNKDFWMDLDEVTQDRHIEWKHVGGHVGIVGNERCDEIATAFADNEEIKLYGGPLEAYDLPNILDISHDETKLKAKKSSSSKSNAKAYSYVSMVNGKIEIHKTWPECEKRVKGAKGARYKKALSSDDEAQLVREFTSI